MSVEELNARDRAAVASLWTEVGLTRPWNSPLEDFDRALNGATSTVLGLRNDEEVIGTVMVGHDGHRGWVYYLAVVPTHQGQGLGKELMKDAEDWLRGRGVVKVQLIVRHSNEAVAGFYHRLGYNDDEVRVLSRWLIDNGRQEVSFNGDQFP